MYFTFTSTDSRTLFSSLILFVFIRIFFSISNHKKLLKIISFIILIVPLVITQLSNYLLEYNDELDEILSNRLYFNSLFLNKMSLINYIAGGLSPDKLYLTVDNGFLLLEASTGIFFLFFTFYITIKKIHYCIDKHEPELCALIISFWYFSFSESSLVRPEAIMGLIFWSLILNPIIIKKHQAVL